MNTIIEQIAQKNIDMKKSEDTVIASTYDIVTKASLVMEKVELDIANYCSRIAKELLSKVESSFYESITQLSLLDEVHFKSLVSADWGSKDALEESLLQFGHDFRSKYALTNEVEKLEVAIILHSNDKIFHESHAIIYKKGQEAEILRGYRPDSVERITSFEGVPLLVIKTNLGLNPVDLDFQRIQESSFFEVPRPTAYHARYLNEVNTMLKEAFDEQISLSIFKLKYFNYASEQVTSNADNMVESGDLVNELESNFDYHSLEEIDEETIDSEEEQFLGDTYSKMLELTADQLISGIDFVTNNLKPEVREDYLAELREHLFLLSIDF